MKEVKFESSANVRMGFITITRKAFKNGKPLGPAAGVSVIVSVEPRTDERAAEIAAEFEADWKAAIAKYNVSVEVN